MLTNENIWKPTTWNDKRERSIRVCGRKRFAWYTIYTVVERVEIQGNTLNVVVAAAGRDYREPTVHDMTNAMVSALVISKQRRFRSYRNSLRIYLEYSGSKIVSIGVDLDETEKKIKNEILGDASVKRLQIPIPSMFLSLLSKMRRS